MDSLIVKRQLGLKLPPSQSAFLWGARKTGKSTFLKLHFPKSLYFDFLNTDLFFEFVKQPSLLREVILTSKNQSQLKQPIILDEVQKIPRIMDEIHWLIENKKLSFILCGSSARKMRRGHTNLLGGRAWRYELYPLTYRELAAHGYDLLQVVNRGLIPSHYLETQFKKSLKAYIQDYLKEEIMIEGLARNIPAFSRFLEAMSFGHGEITNFTNIARECGVDAKTVKEYYQILVDTLLGYFIEPFRQSQRRQLLVHNPKFYLFDVGIANHLCQRQINVTKGEDFGRSFEHIILMEIIAYRAYQDLDFPINYWRTKTGLEIDFVLGRGQVAIEVKGKSKIDKRDLRGLNAFKQDYKPKQSFLVYIGKLNRTTDGIDIINYQAFYELLWQGKII